MTWDISRPSKKPLSQTHLTPVDVLYYFDGPQIFKSEFGFIESFCIKLKDMEEGFLWLCAQIDPKAYTQIAEGKLSVRGAYSQEHIWIVETSLDHTVERYWLCSLDDLSESMLPESGISISGARGVPDHADQLTAFFALHFKGRGINNYSVHFSQFRTIVNNAYDATRRILAPISLVGSRSSVYDFRMKTAPGSLIIAVEEPLVSLKNVDRGRLPAGVGSENIVGEFIKQRDFFFSEVEILVGLVRENNFNTNSAEAKFSILNLIHEIIPSGENEISSVTFTARGASVFENITIEEEVGKVMHSFHKELSRRPLEEIGRVEIINTPSHSFVLLSDLSKKQVTCYLDKNSFEALAEDENFRNGARLKVWGELKKRRVRDEMHVKRLPEFIE